MKTKTKTTEHLIGDDIPHALAWLEDEYPRGVELVYVDYRDSFDDNIKTLSEVLKTGTYENDWEYESMWQSEDYIIGEYKKSHDIEGVSDEVHDAMQEWLRDHDTSDTLTTLLKHTSSKLFFCNTTDDIEPQSEECIERLQKKYARTEEQKKEVEYAINNAFYGAPVSFYFYASPEDVYNALHRTKDGEDVLVVDGAYFSSVDRVQGSNWLGNEAIFTIALSRDDFIKNVHMDKEQGTGYSWDTIAGQSGYDDAMVTAHAKRPERALQIDVTTSEHYQVVHH